MYSKIASLLFVFLFSFSALAITISSPRHSPLESYNKPTHIFVIGYAGGLGQQLFNVAVGRAARYNEMYPNHQVVIIGPDRIDASSTHFDDYEEYEDVLKKLRLKIHRMDELWLLNHRLMVILEKFSKIKSLEFVSHSAAHEGVGLDDIPSSSPKHKYKRFNSRTPGLSDLKNNFTDDAYLIMHGCNSGFIQAPKMAKVLGIPTSGSLTYTAFQKIFSDSLWYFHNDQFPIGLTPSTTNGFSYEFGNKSCRRGHCHRMKPEPVPYSGYWGTLTAGLSHYKFFCGTEVPSNKCKIAMAEASLIYLTKVDPEKTNLENFKYMAKDYLCPSAFDILSREQCFDALESGLTDSTVSFSGMRRGDTLSCDFKTCNVDIQCSGSAGSCQILSADANPHPRTIIEEYRALIEGFELR